MTSISLGDTFYALIFSSCRWRYILNLMNTNLKREAAITNLEFQVYSIIFWQKKKKNLSENLQYDFTFWGKKKKNQDLWIKLLYETLTKFKEKSVPKVICYLMHNICNSFITVIDKNFFARRQKCFEKTCLGTEFLLLRYPLSS